MLAAVTLAGCGGPGRVSRENDRLRARVVDLEAETRRLAGRVLELERALEEATRGEPVPGDVAAAVPHVTGVAIDPLSHARDEDGDGSPDSLVLYVVPSDGLGRFVQAAGTLSAHAAVLPADAEAVTLGRARLDPAALRAAYRSGFMGTHYTVVVPIDAGLAPAARECIARVEYADGRDGGVHGDERAIGLVP